MKIAVRTSVLEKKIVSMHQVGTGSSLRTDATVTVGTDGNWTGGDKPIEIFDVPLSI